MCMALTASGATARAQAAPPVVAQEAGQPVVLDHVIAIINGDVLLQSDVEEEQRFAVLEPFAVPAGSDTLKRAARRLVNRTLILQQMKEQQQLGIKISDEQVHQSLAELRSHLPKCGGFDCKTEEGWKAWLATNGLTESEVNEHWRQRLAVLAFIDVRFRSGIRITPEEVSAFYQKSVLPPFQKLNEKAPPMEIVAPRIQEVVLQQHVNGLLQDWLKSLRDEGSVRFLDASYGQSSTSQGDDDEDNH
jgi:peptidyl-prolyl cis-trans isomerase SurA